MGALLSLPLLAVPSVSTVRFLRPTKSNRKEREFLERILLIYFLNGFPGTGLCSKLLWCCNMFDGLQCLWKMRKQVSDDDDDDGAVDLI